MNNFQNEVIANLHQAELTRKSARTSPVWESVHIEAPGIEPHRSFYAPLLAQTGASLIALGQWLQRRYSETYDAARKTMEIQAVKVQTGEHNAVISGNY